MKLFGRRQKGGEVKNSKLKQKKLNKAKGKTKRGGVKFKKPSDVKMFYIMPIILIIGLICIGASQAMVMHNSQVYKQKVMESSMTYGTELPLWGGTSNGVLKLGHTKLSHNGKDLAVEIQYNSDAHDALSSFGNRYKLRLVDTTNNKMHVKMRYGLFGTDGSGVLVVHSDKGFKNQAFVVMIIDNGHLITSDELNNDSGSTMTDDDLDKSITAQLSNTDDTNSASSSNSASKNLPPLYYARLNAHSTSRSSHNWNNDRDIVEDLFVRSNLRSIEANEKSLEGKIDKGNETLKEMQDRLKENPNDTIAQENVQNLQSSLASLQQSLQSAKANKRKVQNSTIQTNVLDPVQTKYETFTVDNLNQFQ